MKCDNNNIGFSVLMNVLILYHAAFSVTFLVFSRLFPAAEMHICIAGMKYISFAPCTFLIFPGILNTTISAFSGLFCGLHNE